MDSVGNEIRQGFFCPYCLQDLCEQELLSRHVAESHPETTDNNDTIDVLKGALGRAKKKILNIDFSIGASSVNNVPDHDVQPTYVRYFEQPQTIGVHQSLYTIFDKDRERFSRQVHDKTNNLILRMDKLIRKCPSDSTRREFEQDTVPWAKSSSACRVCNTKYTIARREHHCRLCGASICKNCCHFLSVTVADKLTNSVEASYINPVQEDLASKKRISFGGSDSLLKKSSSLLLGNLGLGTSKPQNNDADNLRICTHCLELLERRKTMIEKKSTLSIFVDLYEKLMELVLLICNLAPSYRRSAESLWKGQSMYTLESAIQLRRRLISLQHEIKTLCERIENWGLDYDPAATKPTPRELVLRANIRYIAIDRLREAVLDLPNLPTKDEYKKLQEEHKQRVLRVAEEEANVAIQNQFRTSPSNPQLATSIVHNNRPKVLRTSLSLTGIEAESGWQPKASLENNPFLTDDNNDHPLQHQYLLVMDYLQQAAAAGKNDEVSVFENNLIEIECELKRLNLSVPQGSA